MAVFATTPTSALLRPTRTAMPRAGEPPGTANPKPTASSELEDSPMPRSVVARSSSDVPMALAFVHSLGLLPAGLVADTAPAPQTAERPERPLIPRMVHSSLWAAL